MSNNNMETPTMNSIVQVLMFRDEISEELANEVLLDARKRIWDNLEDPGDVLYDLGLEPDYIWDLV